MTSFEFLHVLKVITMFQVLLRDQWADAVVWPLVQKAGYQIQWVRTTWEEKKNMRQSFFTLHSHQLL